MDKVAKKTITASCPDCEEVIQLGTKPYQGQKITCPNCWAYLEIISLTPLELDWDTSQFEDEEDDDDDDDFDWD